MSIISASAGTISLQSIKTNIHRLAEHKRQQTPTFKHFSLLKAQSNLLLDLKLAMPSTTVWYCCKCLYGPLNDIIDLTCPNCHSDRCRSCETTTISQRYCYQNQEMAGTSLYPEVSRVSGYAFAADKLDLAAARPFEIQTESCQERSPLVTAPLTSPTWVNCSHLVPSMEAPPPSRDIFRHGGRANKCPYSYYCCQCNSGPNLYDIQPACVSCDHKACAFCRAA